jgi:hypothetical protein
MTSEERHEARYQRRKAKRLEKKLERNKGCDFEMVSSFGALRKSFYKARKGTNWKASVQRYGCSIMRNSYNISRKMRKHQNITKGFVEFDLCERGKLRHISSVHIAERVPQKSVCDYGIVPIMEKSMLYENCASQHGKGTEMSLQLLAKQLRRHYRKMGFTNAGLIVLVDCRDYFGSLRHGEIELNMHRMITDEELVEQTMMFIRQFKHGLGLGSQVCQINAVAFPNRIDHYIKTVLGYDMGRYMDDLYVIVPTKEEANYVLEIVNKKYTEIGLTLNTRKTQIVKLSHGFTWLKKKFYLADSGKVIIKPPREKITRDRRKLKKLAAMFNKGEIKFTDVLGFMSNFHGYMDKLNAHRTVMNMDKLFNELFVRDFVTKGGYHNEQIFTA